MKENGHSRGLAKLAKILIVEDEPEIADLFATLLKMEGFHPVVTGSNPEAIQYLDGSRPDLILLDVMLPGATGLQVCRHVRKSDRLADIPIVIVSARTQETDIKAGMEAGADAYLKKPLSNQYLVDTVRRFLADSDSYSASKKEEDNLDRAVEKGLIAVQRYLAEIDRSQRAYKAYLEKLETHQGQPLAERQQAARQAAEMVRRQIRRNQAAGWHVLKDLLERLELKESAIRRRGRHEPGSTSDWQKATARARFVREDCQRWAEAYPEQIVREYEAALLDGDSIYAYLLQRYGTEALQDGGHWEELAHFRARILEVDEPNQEELMELDRFYDRLNPLRAKLMALELPDALLLVEATKSNNRPAALEKPDSAEYATHAG